MAVTATVTVQPEGFLVLKEAEGGAAVSTLRADVFQGQAGADAETATSKSLKER